MSKPHAQKEEIIKKVLEGMSNHGLSCFKSCKKAGIPNSTFLLWVSEDKSLADKYMRARDDLIERIANDAIEIADEPVGTTDSGATDSGAVQKQRLQVDTRKWLLAKLAPRKYGDRLALAGDDESPIKVDSAIDVSKLSTDVLAQIIAAKDAINKG